MNVLLLGNGYDLYHKLPTKYINFLHTIKYIKENKECCFDKPISEIFSNEELQAEDKEIKNAYNLYCDVYNKIKFQDVDVDFIISELDNCWLNYFLLCLNKDVGWIDFEKEISFVIKNFRNNFDEAARSISYEIIVKKFDFLFNKGSLKDDYKKYSVVCSTEMIADIDKIDIDLFKQLEQFAKLLKIYLKYFVDKLLEKLTIENKIDEHLFLENHQDYVITFNYTNTFELINKGNRDVYHIHGNVNDNIVLGLNPDEFDKFESYDKNYLRFKKYFQRTFYKTDIDYLDWFKMCKSNDEEDISLVVMGHSLDVTDKDILEQIFSISTDITILYHDEKALDSQILNLIKVFGKNEFDNIRLEKNLTFLPIDYDFTDIINELRKRAEEEFKKNMNW